ncbi:Rhomboid protease GlpG [Rubripirellula obstinata]|uniref:Rhomboid protease GlpG n=1 Tax=Rubripirellula obstinata TaxID=406547 RepID=A0A5B1CL33_9BACT|nr:rhomboid family intramembrane serine protease [Rubripirellula obstinata]KAA1261778.1 Rhomboid protease GlpG [Rubripirellula obstinata]
MRRIGTLDTSDQARKLLGYLQSESIDAMIDPVDDSLNRDSNQGDSKDGSQKNSALQNPGLQNSGPQNSGPWNLWVRDEVDVDEAKSAYKDFLESPESPKFDVPLADLPSRSNPGLARARQADRRQEKDRVKSARRRAASRDLNQLDMPVGDVARQQSIPVVIGIIIISVVMSLSTNFSKPRANRLGTETLEQKIYRATSFVDRDLYRSEGGDSFASVRKGEVWRFVTPMFLHGDEFHLAFNMLWIFFLGSVIEKLHGSLFFAVLVTLTQLGGMALQVGLPAEDWVPQSLHGSPFVVGASGAVYGLFGFLLVRPWVDGDYPINLVPINVVLMFVMLFAGILEFVPNVANGAHLGGLIAGLVLGAIPFFGKLAASKRSSHSFSGD